MQLGALSTIRISVTSNGNQALGGNSTHPDISDNGRYVTFQSIAHNLVAGDTNGAVDIFVYDRYHSGRVDSYDLSIFARNYGRIDCYVTGGCEGDFTGDGDVDGLDLAIFAELGDLVVRASVNSNGRQATTARSSTEPAISGDGRYVSFQSNASDLVDLDTNGSEDVFVHDLQSSNGDTNGSDALTVMASGETLGGSGGGGCFIGSTIESLLDWFYCCGCPVFMLSLKEAIRF